MRTMYAFLASVLVIAVVGCVSPPATAQGVVADGGAATLTDAHHDAAASAIQALINKLAPRPTMFIVGPGRPSTTSVARKLGVAARPTTDAMRCTPGGGGESCRMTGNVIAIALHAIYGRSTGIEVHISTTEESGRDHSVMQWWIVRLEQRGDRWQVISVQAVAQS